MPSIEIHQVASGPVSFNYTISTPTSNSAKRIDPKLPTILFFHPVSIPQEEFIVQFGDPKIRQFNLVGVDMRSHGGTKAKVPSDFGQEMATEDMARFMIEMKLPPCHIFALSFGTIVALQLAVSHPEKVLSLFLVSPLGLEEPQVAAEGRQAIHDAWINGWRDGKPHCEELAYSIQGALELCFYDRTLSISKAFLTLVSPTCLKNWGASRLDEYRTITLDLFLNRRPHSVEELRNIKVPVKLIHGMEDVGYTLEYSQEFLQHLHDAGVDASLEAISGASHFGCIEQYAIVNPIFHDFIIQQLEGPIPTLTKAVVSPWESKLKKKGWVKEGNVLDDDSDED
ncbi:alpha/beta-hydrolase [Rhodocollybia butyracea]|uniref:Alpha/beta-hydrolase n=1 Tax=Rhodocollybia butyracea TaxID=206335 RepID=A0A9P5P982_9AGAR|nr:alpha/beta-hydrolase [Rhodocollybia butyracea]